MEPDHPAPTRLVPLPLRPVNTGMRVLFATATSTLNASVMEFFHRRKDSDHLPGWKIGHVDCGFL